jgi:hypothetical protein
MVAIFLVLYFAIMGMVAHHFGASAHFMGNILHQSNGRTWVTVVSIALA